MIVTSVDYNRPGKQQGMLQVPYSHNLGGWANMMLPITVINGKAGPGPTILILGGNHGDEYQGQIAIMKLSRELTAEQVAGRLIMIPALNMPAAKAATRLSPLDGKNLNRCFPGVAEGTVSEQIAHYLTHVLFPMSDVVVDIHSGGRSMEFYPCPHMHLVPNLEQRREMLDGLLAWNCDFGLLYTDIAGTGLLPVEAESQGKIVVTTEMGGGEAIPADVHRTTQNGLKNVLVHFKAIDGREQTRESLGLPPTILVEALKRENYLLAPESGVFEVLVDLGVKVSVGQPVGQIHFLERPDRAPEVIVSATEGYMITMRSPCLTQQGDCVAVVAEPIDPAKIRG